MTLVPVVLSVSLVPLSRQILYVSGVWLLPIVRDKTLTSGSSSMTQGSYQGFFLGGGGVLSVCSELNDLETQCKPAVA